MMVFGLSINLIDFILQRTCRLSVSPNDTYDNSKDHAISEQGHVQGDQMRGARSVRPKGIRSILVKMARHIKARRNAPCHVGALILREENSNRTNQHLHLEVTRSTRVDLIGRQRKEHQVVSNHILSALKEKEKSRCSRYFLQQQLPRKYTQSNYVSESCAEKYLLRSSIEPWSDQQQRSAGASIILSVLDRSWLFLLASELRC